MRKKFIFLWDWSTGYIQGSIPSQFSESHKRLITRCGSDGCIQIDGRLSYNSIYNVARDIAKQRKAPGFSVGYLETNDPDEIYSQRIIKLTEV